MENVFTLMMREHSQEFGVLTKLRRLWKKVIGFKVFMKYNILRIPVLIYGRDIYEIS